jgi:[ribosomal protein S18]-alanine N-acetyltransferase
VHRADLAAVSHLPAWRFRDAAAVDLPALLVLEAGFPGDRLSARQFRHHLGRPESVLRLACAAADGTVLGYSLLLRHRDSRLARLYSIVVRPEARRGGIGRALLIDAEQLAQRSGASGLRLEVRADNQAALALYGRRGYQAFARRPGYYEDGATAVRLQRHFTGQRPWP